VHRHDGRPAYPRPVTRTRIPDAVLTAAHDRSRARAAGDWEQADRLRTDIEAAGWTIVDRGTDFALSPSDHPDDLGSDGPVRYGASRNVPSRLDEPAIGVATVVMVSGDHPEDLIRAANGVREHVPPGTSLVVVADEPSDDVAAALLSIAPATPPDEHRIEVIGTTARLGHGAAMNIGVRRSIAPVVIVLDPSVEPTGDFVTPLVDALDDPTVAVAGAWGIVSDDLRHFREAPAGDVDAIEGYCQAFRRADAAARGPFDERFRFYRNLDIWWSLVLRDEGSEHEARHARRLDGLPLVRHEHRGWTSLPDDERDRQSKRNFYRIIDRFGSRQDLLTRVPSA
jgi:cysteinyl-tRNA synthetase